MIKELALISMAVAIPTATRPTPTTIIVSGADYAGIQPYAQSIVIEQGEPMVGGLAWNDGTIVYTVDPTTDYTIHAFTQDTIIWPDEGDPNRQRFDIDLPITTSHKLDWIIYNRIKWEQDFNSMVVDEGLNFFDISDSVGRVRSLMETEGTE